MTFQSTEVEIQDWTNMNFSRKDLENCPDIKIFDSLDGMDLFSYSNCSNDSPDIIKQTRGVVFNQENLVMKSFSYTPEYNNTQIEEIEKVIGQDFKKYTIFDSHEGSLIRIFNFNNKWYLSTHKRIDAFSSRWGTAKSFGVYFSEALEKELRSNQKLSESIKDKEGTILEKFLSILDKNNQYMFLLENNVDNRIVCSGSEISNFYHVGTYSRVNNKFVIDLKSNINVSYPAKKTFNSTKELVDYVANIDYNKLQGVIVFLNYSQIKILNVEYQRLFNIRGNEPSIKFRYLQIRNSDPITFNSFCDLYPSYRNSFKEYEKIIRDISMYIHDAYIRRFIKKERVTVQPEEYSVIRECHSWHIENRQNNRVTLRKVSQVIDNQPAFRINKMIKRFKLQNNDNRPHYTAAT